jgi:hypothetical protein
MKLIIALMGLASASAFTTTSPFVTKAAKLSTRYVTLRYDMLRYFMPGWLYKNYALLSALLSTVGFEHADAAKFRPLGSLASFLVESLLHLLTLASLPSRPIQCCQHGQAGSPRRQID